ncbi:cysteine--tRNA ligase [Sporosarcina sp. P2]|uniref:cysteine--tRNA ligase n=1 Tax=unclassified Sporosarcina TaxID=2647733 RepID=UPI000C168ABC|nr:MULTISPECIES: cysteine--tRNA ligase [unclassified Sporosarcina]PIC70456.1 cysteine--tRNA ligase [Sporosarcina sp. P16b]PID03351.1 cysteine--tRNA ligase [Sporosarcina sp. P2]
MSIQLYNTLTRKKEKFIPIEEGKVKMYVCGPTVYNYIHIGNARPVIAFDTIRRYLEYRGYEVNYVSNFTDVDDKIIKAANDLNEEVGELTERFIAAYHEDVSALGCEVATAHPRVTEHIQDIVEFIQVLIDKGFAYESHGDVYFRTREFEGYGKLSHQSIDELKVGARVEENAIKTDPLDFALWKSAKTGEISWDSPWGTGRPGWHIECSVMAKQLLGDTIDIHAGGQDLTFPHHENEIAQSEAATGKTFANYWMHNGYINIDNEKMSKSLGNFILVHDIRKQIDPKVLRFFMLSVHYRHPVNFAQELVESAANGLERIQTSYSNLQHRLSISADLAENSESWSNKIQEQINAFEKAMDDDFNTANAIASIFELSKQANVYLLEKNTDRHILQQFIDALDLLMGVLGLPFESTDELMDGEVDKLIQERLEARKNRDFARSDEIRDELKVRGIILEDTAQGTRWKRG